PLGRVVGPCALEAAGDRGVALAAAVFLLPAEALLLEGGARRFGTDVLGRRRSAVGLAEGVAADDERNRLLVVHRHAAEGLANVARGGLRIRFAARPFGIDVDEAHLHGAERFGEVPVTAVTLVSEPRVLGTPEDVLR